MRIFFHELSLLAVAVMTALAQGAPNQPPVPDPHRHGVPVHQEPWENLIAPQARFVKVSHPVAGYDTVVSPRGLWRAFVIDRPDEQGDRVCIQEVQTGKQYELLGIPLPYRPISNLLWLDDHLLAFDRWSQPHHGIHYVAHVQHLRLVLSAPFPDEFILRKQGVKQDTLEERR